MKIVVLSQGNPFAVSSASSNRLIGLLKGIRHADSSVEILIGISGGYFSFSEKDEYGSSGIIEGIRYEYILRTPNYSIWCRRLTAYFFSNLNYLIFAFFVKKFLSGFDNQIILWIGPGSMHYRFVKSFKKPVNFQYFTEVNEFPDIHVSNNSLKYFWQKLKADAIYRDFTNGFLPKLDKMALMTDPLLYYFSQICCPNTKLVHIPMTVDLERFSNNNFPIFDNVRQPYIAFIGSMNNAKDGVDILVEAFSVLADKYSEYSLYLYGFWHYDTPGQLRRISELNLQHRVFYRGSIPSKSIPSLISNAQLLVLPRPDSHQARGGFPTKLGEYLATGNPVCATRVGEIPKYLVDGYSVYFADPGSVESLVDSIDRALSDPKKSRMVGSEGRRLAESVFCRNVQGLNLYNFLAQG